MIESPHRIKHGLAKRGNIHPLNKLWRTLKRRWYNKNASDYKFYGGKKIILCDEWHDFKVFHNDCIDLGWKKGLQTHRKNNDKGYSYSNCEFLTGIEHRAKHKKMRMDVDEGKVNVIE